MGLAETETEAEPATSRRRPVRSLGAMVRLTLAESVEGAFWIVIALLLLCLTALLPRLVLFGFGDEERRIAELGLATQRLGALAVALALGAGLPARDRERGSLALYLARPVSPVGYHLGRFAGGLLALAWLLFMLSVARGLTLKGAWGGFGEIASGAYRTWLEGACLLAMGLAAGSALRPASAGLVLLGLFVAGHVRGHLGAGDPVSYALLAAVPDLGAIGAPQTGSPREGWLGATVLALPVIFGYLLVAMALTSGRELRSSGERA